MNTISKISVEDLNVVELQKNLRDKEMTELDFVGDIGLVITKDEVYIKREEAYSPDTGNLKMWKWDLLDNFEIQNYFTVEYEETEQIERVLADIFTKCKRSDQIWPVISGEFEEGNNI